MPTSGKLQSRWERLNGERQTILERARLCASLTIPSIIPPSGADGNVDLPTPWQGLGARAVNNLASKLLLALLPPNSPFFRLKLGNKTSDELEQALSSAQEEQTVELEGMLSDIDRSLAKMEQRIMNEIEILGLRVPSFDSIKQLIVTGNSLEYISDEGKMRVFRFDQYVTKRDPMGAVLEIITHEQIAPAILPEEVRTLIASADEALLDKPSLDLFTQVIRGTEGKVWDVTQECAGIQVPSSTATYPLDASPWIPLRWSALAGEDYGRGLVEEYLGDLKSLDILSQAIVEGSALAARVLFLVAPNGTTRLTAIAKAGNGDAIEGIAQDVTTLQVDKYADFRVALETIGRLEDRIAAAFLLTETVQRDAERVTAEEIRLMASELESALGGVYSVLAQEKQLPLLKRIQKILQKKKIIPVLPDGKVEYVITTGLDALGRSHDLVKLSTLMNELAPLKEAAVRYLDVGEYIRRVAIAIGIDASGLIREESDIQAEEEQAQQQASMLEMAKTGMATQATKGVMDGMAQGAIPPEAFQAGLQSQFGGAGGGSPSDVEGAGSAAGLGGGSVGA